MIFWVAIYLGFTLTKIPLFVVGGYKLNVYFGGGMLVAILYAIIVTGDID